MKSALFLAALTILSASLARADLSRLSNQTWVIDKTGDSISFASPTRIWHSERGWATLMFLTTDRFGKNFALSYDDGLNCTIHESDLANGQMSISSPNASPDCRMLQLSRAMGYRAPDADPIQRDENADQLDENAKLPPTTADIE